MAQTSLSHCVEKGMSIQEIAELLELDIETIKKYLQQQP
jgi:DNA-binding NarL/FixJ family response regulator